MNVRQFENNKDLRFCKIKKGTKIPYEKDWVNKAYTYDEIKLHMEKENNYGVICGYADLIVIDSDTDELRQAVSIALPPTFRVRTGNDGTHDYYFCKDMKKKIVLQKDDKHYGEVQSLGTQIVAPGSIHPSGKKYEIVQDMDIVEITKEQLTFAIKPFMKEIIEEEIKVLRQLKDYGDSNINSINITSVINLSGFKKANNGEYYGSSPWHGSSTGMNTWINSLKNVAHCFRCDSGINVAKAIALNEGLIKNCSDNLSREDFLKVLEIAREKYGLKRPRTLNESKEEKLKIVYDKDFVTMEIKEIEWLIDGILPRGSVGFIAGKRGDFKTFMALVMAFCLATGKPLFNKFVTEKIKVLYIDEENGLTLLKDRSEMIKKGLDLGDDNDVAYLSFQNFKIEKEEWRAKLESFIQEWKPGVIIIDSLRRVTNLDENAASEVSVLFTDIVRPLTEKYGLTWVFLHHLRKGMTGRNVSDELDEMRGSSDFPNYADVVMALKRNRGSNDSFVFKQLKCRYGQEMPAQLIQLTWEQNSIRMDCVGEAQEQILQDELCAKTIMNYLAENEMSNFKKRDIIEPLSQHNSSATLSRALKLLKTSGKLISPKKGYYEVSQSVRLDNYTEKVEEERIQDE